MRRRAFLAATAAVVLWPRTSARAQGDRDTLILRTWRDAVVGHVPGSLDRPAAETSAWSLGDLEDLLAVLRRLPDAELAALAPKALVLHTDVAVLHRTDGGYSLPPTGRIQLMLNDGVVANSMSSTFHWEFCRRLLRALDRDRRQPIGPLWYRAAASFLFSWGELPELRDHLGQGLEEFPRDAELLLATGALHQVLSGPKVQRVFDDPRQARPTTVATAAVELRTAVTFLRRAIEADANLVAARVRLGHVLTDLGQHSEALREAERARRMPADVSLHYYALLVVTRAAFGVGDYRTATDAIKEAMHLYPDAPSPRLAMAYAAHMTGEDLPAGVFQFSPAARNVVGDMWWWLEQTTWPTSSEWLARLRTTFR